MSKSMASDKTIIVLGSGNFGTCLAQHLAIKGYKVKIWTRSAEVAKSINAERKNPYYLSHVSLSKNVSAGTDLDQNEMEQASVLLIAIPTQSIRPVLLSLKNKIKPGVRIVCAAKGIENDTLALPVQIIRDVLGEKAGHEAVVLSGPSFAAEVIEMQPTAVSLASKDLAAALEVQQIFHSPYFRAYTSDDPLGLEVAGALKNVIAIAAGACSGLGYQQNSQAALLTRGLAEITRLGVTLGANPLTFTGLGGVGDLFLTCTSQKSRNFSVGYRLGKGEPLEKVLATVGSVAEGVTTAKAAYELCKKLGVDAPITEQVYQVLYCKRPIGSAVQALMTREAKPELVLPQP